MAPESPVVTCLPQRQVFAQRQIERLYRNKKVIIHTCCSSTRAKLFDVGIDFGSIRAFRVFGDDFNPMVGFEINDDGWLFQCRSNLLRIKNLKEDHFVAAETQWHQVGCELDAPERKTEHLRNGPHHQGFGSTRHACQKTVAADEEGDQDLVEYLILAHDD